MLARAQLEGLFEFSNVSRSNSLLPELGDGALARGGKGSALDRAGCTSLFSEGVIALAFMYGRSDCRERIGYDVEGVHMDDRDGELDSDEMA